MAISSKPLLASAAERPVRANSIESGSVVPKAIRTLSDSCIASLKRDPKRTSGIDIPEGLSLIAVSVVSHVFSEVIFRFLFPPLTEVF